MSATDAANDRRSGRARGRQARRSSVRLSHAVIARAPGLLPMLYTLGELGQELATPVSTLQDWLIQGLPHQRDRTGHIWVNGTEMKAWVESTRRVKCGQRLRKGQAYCLKCRRAVQMVEPVLRQQNAKQLLWSGTCPACGTTVNRGGRSG